MERKHHFALTNIQSGRIIKGLRDRAANFTRRIANAPSNVRQDQLREWARERDILQAMAAEMSRAVDRGPREPEEQYGYPPVHVAAGSGDWEGA